MLFRSLRDPMRKEQYNPLEYKDKIGYFETKIIKKNLIQKITKKEINTNTYCISTTPKLKHIIIRNNSLPLFINV